MWSYRNKIVPPPNFDKDYYRGIGIIPDEEELRLKNPVTYILKKTAEQLYKSVGYNFNADDVAESVFTEFNRLIN